MTSRLVSEQDLQAVAARLPTAPRLLVELGQLMQDPNADATDVVGLLRRDPPLVAQIIRMANSAAYSPGEPIGSLERAIAFVGFVEVHRLVGVVASAQLAEQRLRLYPFDATHLRQNTLFVAVTMEELAKCAGERPRSCYTVGLLRTIGMMALERIAANDPHIPPFRDSGETVLDAWETRHWGISNVEAAERILLHWRLPHETVLAIRHHYDPAGKHNPIIHLLRLAATAASDRFGGLPGEESHWKITAENFAKAGVTERDFQSACEQAQKKFEQLKSAVA